MTACKIIRDSMFLRQKSTLATKEDIGIAEDLKDTLVANQKTAAQRRSFLTAAKTKSAAGAGRPS